MVDIESALRPLVDHPDSTPRPVAEVAARARRRRMRRRSVAAAVAVVALAAIGTRLSRGPAADTTTVDRPPEPSVSTTVPPPTTTPPTSTATTAPPASVTTRAPAPPTTVSPAESVPPGPMDPFDRIEAEAHDAERGVRTAEGPDGGQEIRAVAGGDYVAFDDVRFGTSLATRFEARVASGGGPGVEGTIEVRLDDVASPPFATIAVTSTGSWTTYATLAADTPAIGGTHDLYVTFSSPQPAAFAAIDWFRFRR